MSKRYLSCPWPKNSAGIPYMYGGTPWEEEFRPDDNITEVITEMALSRIIGPLNGIQADIWQEIRERCRERLAPADSDQVYALIRVLDSLQWPVVQVIMKICIATAPHVSLSAGTLEGMLQEALAKGGIRSVDDADALIRGPLDDWTVTKLRQFWPDFDPEQLTIMRPHDGCVESKTRPV